MRIHRSDPAGNYFKHLNDTSRYADLSYAARGYLAEILSRPDGWDETADATWKRARRERGEKAESRRDIQAIWADLKAAGFMVTDRVQLPGGKWAMEVHVFDTPQPPGMPLPGKSAPPAKTQRPASTGMPQAGKAARPAETQDAPASDLPQAGKSLLRQKERRTTKRRSRSLSETLELIVTGATDAKPEEARETVAAIVEAQRPQNPAAYFRTLAKNGDLPLWLDKIRGTRGDSSVSGGTATAGPQTEACRSGNHPGRYDTACMTWCSCHCHRFRAVAS